jgi:hypothetical protein
MKWSAFAGQAWPAFAGHPGLHLRAGILNFFLVHDGHRVSTLSFPLSFDGASIVSKLASIPPVEILRR